MTSRFTPAAERALQHALKEAKEFGHPYIGTEHLLLGLLSEEDCVAARILNGRGIRYDPTKKLLGTLIGRGTAADVTSADLTPRLREVLEEAAKSLPGAFGRVGSEQLLNALLACSESAAEKLLAAQNVSAAALLGDAALLEQTRREQLSIGNESKKSKLPPTLAKYGVCLSDLAERGEIDPVIGREEETERLLRILCRRVKNNPCLIGDPGVGKTAVVEGLAQRIVKGEVPAPLKNKRLITLDLSSMLAGAKYRGDFEERMKTVLAELEDAPDLLLFIDEIHTIVGAGSAEGSLDAANILKPALARGKLRLIGATTTEEYRKHIEHDAALERRFQPVTVEEPSPEATLAILRGLRSRYERHHGLPITDGALEAALSLSIRYLPERHLPDKALDLLDEAASAKRIRNEQSDNGKKELQGILLGLRIHRETEEGAHPDGSEEALTALEERCGERLQALSEPSGGLTEKDVSDVLAARLGHAVFTDLSPSALPSLEPRLKERIFGQEAAVDTVCRTLRRGMLGLTEGERPLASFLFYGPPGVGKTALAEAVAEELFGHKRALLRFDMSEYREKHSVSTLVGSPPGYVGYGEEGLLTGQVRKRPYSLLLFDEAHRAHPDVYGLFLQILDSGFLTDASGRRVDFRNTVVILTAEEEAVGSGGKTVGFTAAERSASGGDVLRPELLCRLDHTVRFAPLSREAAEKIADKQLENLALRLSRRGVSVTFSDALRAHAAKQATAVSGARGVLRYLREEVEEALIAHLTAFPPDGASSLFGDEKNGKIVFEARTPSKMLHIL